MRKIESNMTPPEVASVFLSEHGGMQRNAEVAAWKEAEKHPIGPDMQMSPGRAFWVKVIDCICFGGEIPAVERKAFVARPLTIEEIGKQVAAA